MSYDGKKSSFDFDGKKLNYDVQKLECDGKISFGLEKFVNSRGQDVSVKPTDENCGPLSVKATRSISFYKKIFLLNLIFCYV